MKKKIHLLMSFAYYKDESTLKFLRKYKNHIELLFDSGAYTAYTRGKNVDVHEYCSFIDQLNEIGISYKYITLDTIGDPKKTLKTFEWLLKKGYNPIPVFTRGDSLEALEYYYGFSDLVALGGIAVNKNNTAGYVKYIMRKGIKGRKVHWLGWGKRDFLLHFKPYSTDSSSISIGGRFGNVAYLKHNMLQSFDRHMGTQIPVQVRRLVNRLGMDINDSENWKGKTCSIPRNATYLSFMEYHELLFKLGIRFYLVDAALHNTRDIVQLYIKHFGKDEKND